MFPMVNVFSYYLPNNINSVLYSSPNFGIWNIISSSSSSSCSSICYSYELTNTAVLKLQSLVRAFMVNLKLVFHVKITTSATLISFNPSKTSLNELTGAAPRYFWGAAAAAGSSSLEEEGPLQAEPPHSSCPGLRLLPDPPSCLHGSSEASSVASAGCDAPSRPSRDRGCQHLGLSSRTWLLEGRNPWAGWDVNRRGSKPCFLSLFFSFLFF